MNLSVVIPCYNADDTLGVQLEALSQESWSQPWEVILSDNGSTDGSKTIAEAYAHRFPSFKIIDSSAVKGPAHARNAGAKAAQGESLLFCDADDAVAPGWLSSMGTALKLHDFVTCRFEAKKLSAPLAVRARQCPQETGIQTYDYPPYLPHAASASIGIKRKTHEMVGGFDEKMPMLEDTDYCWRVQLSGTPLRFVDDAMIHYRLRGSLRKILRQSMYWGEYNVYLYKKYRPMGMPRLSWKTGLQNTWRLFRRMPHSVVDPDRRLQWLWHLAWQAGRFLGCVKYRTFAL
jgi:GT2 family glycosyltransferase